MTSENTAQLENPDQPFDDGPGWLPAILAATALLGIVGFIFCGFSTWYLFEQRTSLAVRTLRGSLIPQIEQSLLEPDSKASLLKEIDELASDMERGKYENWQSSGVMQRLQRLPVIQWGEIEAVEAIISNQFTALEPEAKMHLSRIRHGVDIGIITSFDFEEVLSPVRIDDLGELGHRLNPDLDTEHIAELLHRADIAADRAGVPEQNFETVQIATVVRRQIEIGTTEGGY